MRILLSVAVMYMATLTAVQAFTIVNWVDADWVSANQDLEGKDTTSETNLDLDGDTFFDDSRSGRAFSTTTALNPTSGYNTSLDSAIFYGGAVMGDLDDDTADGFTDYNIKDQGPNDSIHLHLQTQGGGHAHNFQSVYYWDQADFLNGADSATVSLDGNSSFTLDLQNVSGKLADPDGELRWVIRNSSQFYISETNSDPGNSTFTLNNFGGAGDNWAAYNPSGLDIDFDDGAAAFTFTSSDFTDITGVGFYIAHDVYGDNNLQYHVHQFTVNAYVPEPSSTALLGLGALAFALRRKRA